MTNEDAIKYLRQIYPQGGHCWLDEQRMEAIGMAIDALSKESGKEGPILANSCNNGKNLQGEASETLGDEIDRYLTSDEFALAERAGEAYGDIARHFADWQREQFERNRLADCEAQTAEEYIKAYTRRCSNETTMLGSYDHTYQPWMTVEGALEVVRLARREALMEIKQEIDMCAVKQYQFPILHLLDYIDKELGLKPKES